MNYANVERRVVTYPLFLQMNHKILLASYDLRDFSDLCPRQ